MTKLEELKKWLKDSQENLNKEYEKRYQRISISKEIPSLAAESVKEPEFYVNVYDETKVGELKTGLIHFDAEEAKKKQAEDFVYKGTYKLVKID